MKGNMEERAVRLAQYIIENRATVRAAAAKFGVSKSTVHKDLSERLPTFNRPLYLQAKAVLEEYFFGEDGAYHQNKLDYLARQAAARTEEP